eukprot:g32992.t1
MDKGIHQFHWDNTRILGQVKQREAWDFLEAWYSTKKAIDKHVELDPIYNAKENRKINEYSRAVSVHSSKLLNLTRRLEKMETGHSYTQLDFELLKLEIQELETLTNQLRNSLNNSNSIIDQLYAKVRKKQIALFSLVFLRPALVDMLVFNNNELTLTKCCRLAHTKVQDYILRDKLKPGAASAKAVGKDHCLSLSAEVKWEPIQLLDTAVPQGHITNMSRTVSELESFDTQNVLAFRKEIALLRKQLADCEKNQAPPTHAPIEY